MTFINIKSKDGSKCIYHGIDGMIIGTNNTIDYNPNQILYTRIIDNRIIIHLTGRWIELNNKEWDSKKAEAFYNEKLIPSIKNNENLTIE